MASNSGLDPRRYPPRILSGVGIVAFVLFLASFLVEVRIVFEQPNYGDVTGVLWTLWRVALGVATIGSFLLAGYRSAPSDRENVAGGLEIRGRNHDIEVHLHLGEVDTRDRVTDRVRAEADTDGTRESVSGENGGERGEST